MGIVGTPCRRILVVDDDSDTANAIKYTVESFGQGLSCSIAADPYEALLTMTDNKFDFVLVDQKIPGLMGTEILKKLDGYIDSDPLLNESGNYIEPTPVAIMSTGKLPEEFNLSLKNFKMTKFIN